MEVSSCVRHFSTAAWGMRRFEISQCFTAAIPESDSALFFSPLASRVRRSTSFPAPTSKMSHRGPQKTFNFLTHERLQATPVEPIKISQKRQKSVHQAKLSRFKDEIVSKIENHVHYFSKEVSDFVFHAIVQEKPQCKTFVGHRQLAPRTHARLHLHVLHELMKGKNRQKLLELIEKAHLKVPSRAMWDAFTDKKTGDITCRLMYSKYIVKALRSLTAGRDRGYFKVPFSSFYVGLNFFDAEKIPSLHEWWHQIGPVTKKDLVFGRAHGVNNRLIHQSREDLLWFGKKEVDAAMIAYTAEDTERLFKEFKKHSASIMRRVEQHHVFVQTILLAVNSLPEIRVITGPKGSFQQEHNGHWYLQQHGAYYPDPSGADKAWLGLPQEGKQKYLPFGTKPSGTRSGVQAFLKYCQRDYGLTLLESRERFSELSDVQQAAMNFPFHVSLTNDRNPISRPFRRFLKDKLMEYGLLRPSFGGNDGLRFHCNRKFSALMKVKWMNLSAEERRLYEEEDIANVFPLQPTKHVFARDGRSEEDSHSSRILWSSLVPDNVTDEDSQRYLEEFGKGSKRLIQLQEEHDARREERSPTTRSTQ